MKIYVFCDLEGASGIVDHKMQCWSNGKYFEQSRRIATMELNSLVQGAIDGGATEIYAWDGHCNFPGGLDVELLHKDCKLIMGAGDGGPVGLDSTFDAVFLYGFHAMAGVPNAVLSHSFMPHVQEIWLNNIKIGEIGLNCALAGSFDVPSIFISGDKAAIIEAKNLVPQIEGVVVKEGLSCNAVGLKTSPAISLSVKQSCERIYQSAKESIKKCSDISPFFILPPYTFRVKYYKSEHAEVLSSKPGVDRVDEYTVQYSTESLLEFEI